MEWCECLCEKQRHRQHLLELLSTGLKPLEVSTVTLSMKYLETFCSIIRLNNSSTLLKCNFTHAYALFFFPCLLRKNIESIAVCHASSETVLPDPDLPRDAALCRHSPSQQVCLLTHCTKSKC